MSSGQYASALCTANSRSHAPKTYRHCLQQERDTVDLSVSIEGFVCQCSRLCCVPPAAKTPKDLLDFFGASNISGNSTLQGSTLCRAKCSSRFDCGSLAPSPSSGSFHSGRVKVKSAGHIEFLKDSQRRSKIPIWDSHGFARAREIPAPIWIKIETLKVNHIVSPLVTLLIGTKHMDIGHQSVR